MRAIIETGGLQIPVEENSRCRIPKIDAEPGKEVDFDRVLLISKDDKPLIGKPYIEGASVKAEVISHGRSDKINVFKFKKRLKYRKKTGHRQQYTEILVKEISS
ncbi:MAG: 50S ribosomal protein L21 [Candidatus Zixiibacteriota bacterium]|nr:MAG: 50S ribosomal protein L21 [candidate division Zixibacteria bacterium]